MASARINSVKLVGQTASANQYVMEVLLDGNGSAAKEVTVYFTAAFGSTKAQRNSAGATAIIAAGAAQSPAFSVTTDQIGPD